jgi:hypothetical protein
MRRRQGMDNFSLETERHVPLAAGSAVRQILPMRSSVCLCLTVVLFALVPGPAAIGHEETSPKWIGTYNTLLAKYVTSDGVRYAAWKDSAADMQAIQNVVDGIANEKLSGLNKKQQLAFYLNAYNAWILREALARYPAKSVKDLLFTFFTGQRLRVAGEPMSFNRLEKDIIGAKFNEPRIHFALNCASRSCPPLNPEAFRADKLDSQLEKLSVAFVNSSRGVDYSANGKAAALSAIFNWYKDDFKAAGGPIAFINQRRNPPLPNDTKITYQDYDWSLNEVK